MMTPQEFKAWFEGFTEAFTGTPTKTQWERIKERVGEIDGKPVTERVFVDRYWPYHYPINHWYWNATTSAINNANNATTMALAQSNACNKYNAMSALSQCFNSTNAMADLGRADYQALAQ